MTSSIGCTPRSIRTRATFSTLLYTAQNHGVSLFFLCDLREKHDVSDAVFLVDSTLWL